MATAKKKTAKQWADTQVPADDLSPGAQVAREILTQYADLLPSVTRIMESGLSADECHQAMTLFQTSLGAVGDPNRDPRVAIENARVAAAR